jgi:hypothetical protein
MSEFIYQSLPDEGISLDASDAFQVVGMVSPSLVDHIYPYRELTRWHNINHIPGLTGRWMDTGATALGGAVKGSYHRLVHGHHLLEDGIKVLTHSELKFGQFLHHLGMDSLTSRGIPNPLIPKMLIERLIDAGLPASTVSEWASINVPKILGGGLSLVLAGDNVLMAFSDALPHTWWTVGKHFTFGVLDTVFGVIAESPLMLVAAAGEFSTSGITAWRLMMDQAADHQENLSGFFIPALGDAIGIGPLMSAASSLTVGGSLAGATDAAIASTAAITAASYAKMAKIGLLVGLPVAGLAAGLIARKILRSINESHEPLNYLTSSIDEPQHVMPLIGFSPIRER